MVPRGRFELPQPCGHYALNVARLPVPPPRQQLQDSIKFQANYQLKLGEAMAAGLIRFASYDHSMD